MKTRFQAIRALTVGLLVVAAMHVGATAARAAIVALLETPTESAEVFSGIANVQGWAYATEPGDEIEPLIAIFIDGEFVMEVPCCSDRGDVKDLHPTAPMRTGFSGAFNYSSLEPGAHVLQAHIYSQLGEHEVLSTTFFTERLGSFPYNKKFDWTTANADHCERLNKVIDGHTFAVIRCKGMTFERSDGTTEQCVGQVDLTWMPSSQGFRVTEGCSQLN